MKEILRFFDWIYFFLPYVWGVMAIVYMIGGIKFNAFSMLSVVICWVIDRHNRSKKETTKYVAQND